MHTIDLTRPAHMPCRNMRPQQAFSAGQQRVPVAARSRAASRGSQIPAGGSRVRTERCAAHSDAAPSCNATARRAMLAAPLLAWALQAGIAKAAGSNLSIEEVERRLKKNFQEDQYYVSGKLDSTIFADGCVFTDPTVVSRGAPKRDSVRRSGRKLEQPLESVRKPAAFVRGH